MRVSAGVGRTGTYIAVDTLMNKLHDQTTVDVYGVVYKMRLHRPYMVQTAVTICSVLFFSRLRSQGWHTTDVLSSSISVLCHSD